MHLHNASTQRMSVRSIDTRQQMAHNASLSVNAWVRLNTRPFRSLAWMHDDWPADR